MEVASVETNVLLEDSVIDLAYFLVLGQHKIFDEFVSHRLVLYFSCDCCLLDQLFPGILFLLNVLLLVLIIVFLFLLLLLVDLLELCSRRNIVEVSLAHYSTLLHHNYLTHCLRKFNCMSGHYYRPAF